MKTNLTDRRVLSLPEGKYTDTQCPYLKLYVRASGVRTFVFNRRITVPGKGSKLIKRKLGRAGDLTVAEARKRCLTWGESDNLSSESSRTLSALWQRYFEIHSRPKKRTWQEDEAKWNRYCEQFSETLAEQFDLAAFHARLGLEIGHVTANRVCSMLSKMYRVSNLDPPRWSKFREESRERFLSKAEIARLLKTCDGSSIGDFVRMLLATGARCGNVRRMRWSQLRQGVWTIPAAEFKNGSTQRVHLVPEARAVLSSRRHLKHACDWVFPQRRGLKLIDAPMSHPQKAWKALCKEAGITGCRIHDLRRSVGSHLAMAGVPIPVIASILGHRDLKSTQVYSRVSSDVAAEALDNLKF